MGMMKMASRVVEEYGRVLATLDTGVYGAPASLLPCDKAQIKASIRHLILHLDDLPEQITEALTHGYVYLAQFIADDQATVVADFQARMSNPEVAIDICQDEASHAIAIINQIKLAMENAAGEAESFLARRQR